MSAFFSALGKYQRHVRLDAQRRRSSPTCSTRGRATTTARSRRRSTAPNIPTSVYTRLDRRRQPAPADVPSLPEAAAEDDEAAGAALLRPLRAARRVGGSQLHGRGSEKHVLTALAPLGPDYAAAAKRAFNERWIDLYPNEGKRVGRLLERRRLRRAPVHAAQLQRQVHGREHGGARARPHDAELLLEQDAAVPDRVDYPIFVAEVASTFNEALLIDYMLKTIKDDDDASCRCSATISRTSRARCSGRRSSPSSSCASTRWREGRADHRRGARQALRRDHRRSTTATTRASASSTTTSPTSGRSSRTSTATSTCSSTRRPSPRRRRCRRRCWPATRRRRSAT